MNAQQTQYLNCTIPTIKKPSFNHNIQMKSPETPSDRSLSPNLSTNNSSTSYEIASQQSSNSSRYIQHIDESDPESIMDQDDGMNDRQFPSTQQRKNNNSINMKIINNQHQPYQAMNNHKALQQAAVSNNAHIQQNNYSYFAQKYDQRVTMIQNGFQPLHCIARTLQGSIWKVKYLQFRCEAVIKVTNKSLANSRIGFDHRRNRYVYDCSENIMDEIKLLHTLSHPRFNKEIPKPEAMIDLYKVFDDKYNIFVVMEYGGRDLLQFINECHTAVKNGKMLIDDWKLTVKLMFKQMIEFIHWLHNVKQICHLDVSLENMLIRNVEKEYDPKTRTFKISPTFQIKFCDFGLAELFTKTKREILKQQEDVNETNVNTDDERMNEFDHFVNDEDVEEEEEEDLDGISFICRKFVGKLKYECPEIFYRDTFDARAADIWSLGVVLFMIAIGTAPWKVPCGHGDNMDKYYDRIINQHDMKGLLSGYRRLHYIDDDEHDLLYKMFSDHMYRIDAKGILEHPWMNNVE